MSKKTFDDGSSVEWVDKETVRYSEGEFSVLIWVDFEPGFWSSGRVIRSSSIKNWSATPTGCSATIDAEKKREIIDKIQRYYGSLKKKCRVLD